MLENIYSTTRLRSGQRNIWKTVVENDPRKVIQSYFLNLYPENEAVKQIWYNISRIYINVYMLGKPNLLVLRSSPSLTIVKPTSC